MILSCSAEVCPQQAKALMAPSNNCHVSDNMVLFFVANQQKDIRHREMAYYASERSIGGMYEVIHSRGPFAYIYVNFIFMFLT